MAKQKYVVFRLDKVLFGIHISLVSEIINPLRIFLVPKSPDAFEGLINVRGSLHPVFNLRSKFNLNTGASTKSRMLLIRQLGNPMGFLVDEVSEIIEINEDERVEIPLNVGLDLKTTQHYLQGIVQYKEKLILLINALEAFQ